MRSSFEIALIIVGGLLGWFFWQEHGDRLRAEAQQELLREDVREARTLALEADGEADAARARAIIAEDSLRAVSRVAEQLSDSLSQVAEETVVIVEVAAADLRGIFRQIREQLPEPALPLVDSAEAKVRELTEAGLNAVDLFGEERASFAAFRAQTDSTLFAITARAEAAERAALSWEATAGTEAARADNAERLATPGVLSRIRGSLPFFSIQGTVAGVIGLVIGIAATR